MPNHPSHERTTPLVYSQPLQLPLFSILTLCCSCHRLKAQNGRWSRRVVQQDMYPKTIFSHGICPSCFKQLYPSAYRRRRKTPTLVEYRPSAGGHRKPRAEQSKS